MRTGPLRERSFRLLFAARAISSFGDQLVPVALTFAVLEFGSLSDLGIVLAAQSVPLVLFVLLGGVWADRLPRQRVMLASDLVRFAVQGASAAVIIGGTVKVWQLVVLQAVYGMADGFFAPAANGLVPQVVAAEDLQRANAMVGVSENATSILGPAVAGILVVGVGAGWGLAVDAATFVLSAAFLSALRIDETLQISRERATSVLHELREGWKSFSSRRWLLISVGYFTLMYAFAFSVLRVLGPDVAKQFLGGPGAWAAISAVTGAGAIAGGLLALRWKPARPLRAAFALGLFGAPLTLLLLGAHAALWVILVTALIEGVVGSFFNAIWFTAMHEAIPAEEISRVSSWDAVGSYALAPVGLALAGPIAAAVGVSTTLYAAGGISLAITLALIALPSIRDFTGGPETKPVEPLAP